jgi:glyoxylase-like metal-dependent hydrolase (beta-lactamase superfamily II)
VFDPILLPAFNPGPMTGDGNNTYLIVESGGGAALIDAGIGDPRHLAAIEDALRSRRAQLNDVYVTHAHGDHASGAVALSQAYPRARFSKYLSPAYDARYPISWLPLADGDEVPAGDTGVKVLYTPGHAPDHVAFWHEETRTAFTGDLVVQGTTVMIGASKGGDLSQYLASLARIMAMKASRLLPGHGPEIVDPETVLNRYIEHRQRREQQVLEALDAGFGTVQTITESIYHGLPPALMPAAAENVRAHLDKLRRDGRAGSDDDRWTLK